MMTLGAVTFYVVHPHVFANPWVDVVRVLCVIAAVLMVMVSIRVVIHMSRVGRLVPGQFDRFKCMWLSGVSIAYTELIMQGTALTPRLLINAGALFYGLRGAYKMRQEQKRR